MKCFASSRETERVDALARAPSKAAIAALVLACFAPRAAAQTPQIVYSIDWTGPTKGQPSSSPGTLITESDLLIPPAGAPAFGPLARPQILLNGGQLGLQFYSFCNPQPGGPPCRIELDGLSFGDDYRFETAPGLLPPSTRAKLWFSVDKYAVGIVGSIAIPNVRSEAPVGDSAADVFTALDLPPGPLPPFAIPPANTGLFDGNGLVSGSGHSYPGVGLVEPTSPLPGPDTGDNIDALAIGPLPTGPGAAVYFSLDAGFIDPLTGLLNTDSASAQGVPAAAVLRKLLSGGSPTVWATPLQLGLDLSGPGTDDLDALILFENGTGVFEPSLTPYDWLAPGGPDMLLFSVRRGSALIGQSDSIFGLPIEPGDVLTTPSTPGGRPGIFIAAENLGLATVRSSGVIFGDDLDALASTRQAYFDCNHNGVEDAVDIASGASSDTNENGIPDECEHRITAFCYCPPPVAPCGNDDASAGCKNSTGVGGLLDSSGTTSVSTDDLVLTASQLNHNGAGLFLRSLTQTSVPFKDGLLCVGSPFYRFGLYNSGASGSVSKSGLVASSMSGPPGTTITAGTTWNFQYWYRNFTGPCGMFSNTTNGLEIVFTP